MTKEQYITQFKGEHSELFKQVNGERIKLTDAEYEATIAEWADNAVAQEAEEAALASKEAEKAAILEKLGLTADELQVVLS